MQGLRLNLLDRLDTEQVNPRTVGLDRLPTPAMIRRLQREDAAVAKAVARTVPAIARAVDAMAARFQQGGRIIYIGAGTSGRLGVLDASECPPTFGVAPGRIVGVIAGGKPALTRSSEGIEDSASAGRTDLAKLRLTSRDCVVGIAASGRTPYTVAAVAWARRQGCFTVAIVSNRNSPLARAAELAIEPLTGAESIAGSTRMKAGTAQKMVLNLLSTGVMVRVGRTRGNLMAHMHSTNLKLRRRAARIRQAGEQ
ncbi:MAG TPA: N-acetylmuramic acid 6-phosphate etherase [Terriglobales bacterium]|nr:N-acetylmuramic acid 6-phosphate etherase [Terriglobales bacterium]